MQEEVEVQEIAICSRADPHLHRSDGYSQLDGTCSPQTSGRRHLKVRGSIFSRMGRRTCDDREVQVHFAEIDTLQREHQHTAADHAEVDRLGRRWLIDGDLGASDIARLTARLDNLATVYRRHIALEDNQLFPLARRVLSAATVQEIGREMARRRGLDPDSRARFRTGHCAAR